MVRLKALIRWGYHNDLVSDISFLDKLEPWKDIPHREKIQNKFLESDELKDVCKKIKLHMLQQRLAYGYTDSGLFLCDIDGEHVSYYAYNKYLRENSQKTLGHKTTAHTLRHTHASLLMEQGVNIGTISRRLGHENSQVTKEIYLHITGKLKEKDNEEIAKARIM
ncbi:site-specific integrase [Clostridium sp. C105KSO13]|uniref:site-specific integrase n=1 Tax=Clostridium sp. C105KSO13 TaxID=1776045 RepID=UPI0007405A06|nr:site-specific integrase [Clostridium sp. C105KSO13]CUX23308.1 site-specific tyrosine recombinase XerS [Clostridium sp. C105KSO13]